MELISSVMGIVAALLQVYTILIFIRVVLSWLSVDSHKRPWVFISRVTDPYLNWFRRFRFLQIHRMDLTPLLAIFILQFFQNLATKLFFWRQITVALTLSVLISQLWAVIGFLLLFYSALAAIRFLSLWFHWKGQAVWNIFDLFLRPFSSWYGAKTNHFTAYPRVLFFVLIIGVVLWIAGSMGCDFVIALINQLPI